MTRKNATIPAEYFEEKYKANIDPWQFRTSDYEHYKYAATLGALTKSAYSSALEAGCSIGVLTRMLSPRCNRLLAIDASATALEEASSVNSPNVTFQVAKLPHEFPDDMFDLIVLSEVLYYFDKPDLEQVARSCGESISREGEIVLCHWLGTTDYPLTGVEASEQFSRFIKTKLPVRSILYDSIYRLERFSAR